jgi:hypothetical protein
MPGFRSFGVQHEPHRDSRLARQRYDQDRPRSPARRRAVKVRGGKDCRLDAQKRGADHPLGRARREPVCWHARRSRGRKARAA